MSYDYTDGDGLAALDKTKPDGATESLNILDNAIRQIKAYLHDPTEGPEAMFQSLLSPTRVVVTLASGQAVVAGAGEVTVEFNNEDLDSGSDFSVVTYKFTAPDSGLYLCLAALTIEETANSSPTDIKHEMNVYVDGTSGAKTTLKRGTDIDVADLAINRLFNLTAGQTLSVRYTLTVGSGSLSVSIKANPLESIFQVVRIPTL